MTKGEFVKKYGKNKDLIIDLNLLLESIDIISISELIRRVLNLGIMKDLKTLRNSRGLTLAQLAQNASLYEPTVQNIESGKRLPQADCRRRLEIVLGARINWLKTCGVRMQLPITWERVEQDYRRALMNITGLPTEQQHEFLRVAQEYLKTIEEDLIPKSEFETILPSDFSAMTNRKRKSNNYKLKK